MTEAISVEDLIDMGDHCFLCFRECSLEEDKNELDKDAKNVKVFLKTLERYLKLPDVNVDYVNESDSNIVKKQLRKKWHQLVRGRVCSHCNYLVNSTSGIFLEYERLKMLMDWKMREVDEHFQFIEENPNCNAAKQRLVEKWEKEERNSGLYLNMFKILKSDLSRIVARIEQSPKVAAARLSDAIKPQSVPAIHTQTATKLQQANETNQTASRQRHVSFCDDSGLKSELVMQSHI